MKTDKLPPLPTREQELKYLEKLETSLGTDPWLTIHPRKYMATPYRLMFKNKISYRNEYYKTFALNGIASFIIASPLIA